MSSFEEILARDGRLVYKIKGVSMLPMLRQNRDVVVISLPDGPLKKYDVALYKRGKAYVLHRVIDVIEWGYAIRGDNTYVLEKVPEKAIVGVLTDFTRKSRTYSVNNKSYLRYVRIWCAIYPLRAFYAMSIRRMVKLLRKVCLKRSGSDEKRV